MPIAFVRLACALTLLALSATPSEALNLRDLRWSFGELRRPGRFLQLALLMENDTEQPFAGRLTVARKPPAFGARGSTYARDLSLGAGQRSWVRLLVMFADKEDV